MLQLDVYWWIKGKYFLILSIPESISPSVCKLFIVFIFKNLTEKNSCKGKLFNIILRMKYSFTTTLQGIKRNLKYLYTGTSFMMKMHKFFMKTCRTGSYLLHCFKEQLSNNNISLLGGTLGWQCSSKDGKNQ